MLYTAYSCHQFLQIFQQPHYQRPLVQFCSGSTLSCTYSLPVSFCTMVGVMQNQKQHFPYKPSYNGRVHSHNLLSTMVVHSRNNLDLSTCSIMVILAACYHVSACLEIEKKAEGTLGSLIFPTSNFIKRQTPQPHYHFVPFLI